MKKLVLGAALILAAVLAAVPLAAATGPTAHESAHAAVGSAHGSRVVGYFIEWGIYGRGYRVKDVATSGSAAKLTAINYAFGDVAPDATVTRLQARRRVGRLPVPGQPSSRSTAWPRSPAAAVLGNFQQLQALKELHPPQGLISLGGWTCRSTSPTRR